MIRPCIALGTTLIISLLILNQAGFTFAVAVLIAAICFGAIFFFLRTKNNVTNIVFLCLLALIVSASSFITKTAADWKPSLLLVSEETKTVEGKIYDYEKDYAKYYYTLSDVTVNGVSIDYKVRFSTDIYQNINIDDTLTLTNATIYELGGSSGNQAVYKADGIYLGVYTSDDFSVIKTEKHSVRYYINEVREYIDNTLDEHMNEEYAAVAKAMLTGNQSDISNETLANFRYSGISHLFAVSGFHLSLWTSAIYVFMNKISDKKRYISNIVCIIFIIFFMALTGFSKSVIRAGVMLLILIAGRFIKYQADPINSLFISASIILLINPFAVMSVSFLMSFSATLGILLLSTTLSEPILNLKEKIKSKKLYNAIVTAYTTVTISVVASLFTMPVSAICFGYISLVAPITNLLCMLPSQLVIIISGLDLIVAKLSFLSKPLSIVITLLTKYLLFVTEKLASLRGCILDTTSPFILIPILIITLLMAIFLIIFRKSQRNLRLTVLLTAAAVSVISVCTLYVQSMTAKITVADTGNGTSIILNTGNAKAVIGCGGSSYKSYKLTDCTDINYTHSCELLLIPRNTKTESEYAYDLLSAYSFDNCIVSDDDYADYITELFPESTFFTDYCTVKLDEKTNLIYINNDDISALRIESDIFTCTVLFVPVADFSLVPDAWQSGSLLITRQSLPDIDLSGFDNIIVSSDKEVIYTNNNIYTTKYSGKTVYRMYPTGFALLTEENHDYK